MPTPEQERPLSAEQQKSFSDELRGLVEGEKWVDGQGKLKQRRAIVRHQDLREIVEHSFLPKFQTPEELENSATQVADWLDGKRELFKNNKITKRQFEDFERQALALEYALTKEWERKKPVVMEREEEKKVEERKEAREALFGQNIEPYLGAVFEKGRYESYIRTGQINRETNIVLDVTNPRDRERWLLENVRAAMDGTIPNPEETWKSIVDFWRLDFSEAARREKLSFEEREEFDKEIRSAMAICASARAMEQSDGAAATYLGFITQSSPDNPYLDRKDDWAEYLLHGDEGKIKKALENPLVFHYYKELLRSVGIGVVEIWEKGEAKKPIDEMSEEEAKKEGYRRALEKWDGTTVNKDVFLVGKKKDEKGKEEAVFKEKTLPYFLVKGRGGMNAYIREVIKDKIGDYEESERWAAAKLACDIFLVDKYTKWEFAVNEKGEIGQFYPSVNWGGDPLRALLEPSFLPRWVKKVYKGEGNEIVLDLVDKSFRGVVEEYNISPLEASMVVDLKAYARWSEALWTFLGGSRAPKISQWTERVMYEDLPKIAELLDQVYGEKDKRLMGLMMAEIIKTKALAAAMVSSSMGWKEAMKILFGGGEQTEVARPFLKVEQFLWGPERDARKGFLADLASGRTRFLFDDKAKTELNEAAEILFSCDQTFSGRRKAKTLNTVGFILDVIGIIARGGKGK